ncbi:UDP-N-acetylglucosamine 2-epimerase (non-hydrolyzing) [Candidatus Binatia bacterium]|jgi:UDP-N-acetylglucosamine 2-epimerase (non-hydrolysing)|nr:UDP-N-acetylglucosamine 2-epimerase (non-hydrolyzing) [Candidatus Binatia bacterium]
MGEIRQLIGARRRETGDDRCRIVCVVGTRPEAIKMAPVIEALRRETWASPYVLLTAQHREMLDQVMQLFAIRADDDLNVMRPNQQLAALTAQLITGLDAALERARPDAVLAQGDTTTVLCAALVSFYRRVPFGHVEAGLRTHDLASPFPEEANRVLASRLTRWHFAPTASSRANLLREGIEDAAIHVTGNTVIDALLSIADRARGVDLSFADGKRLLLMTAHRRENFGAPMNEVFAAVRELVDRFEDLAVLYPVHPNPNVKEPAERILGGHPRIRLVAPLDYEPFVAAMSAAHLIVTDSGGVQEEAPALAKPVLVLRNETERPEAVDAGVVKLVGPVRERIVREVATLLTDPAAYAAMARGVSPYGDGHAAGRIVAVLARDLAMPVGAPGLRSTL